MNAKALTFGLSSAELAATVVSSGLEMNGKHFTVFPAFERHPKLFEITLHDVVPNVHKEHVEDAFAELGNVVEFNYAVYNKFGLELQAPFRYIKLILKDGKTIDDIPMEMSIIVEGKRVEFFRTH